MGKQLQTRSFENVLCHTDIHAANILVSEEGRIYLNHFARATLGLTDDYLIDERNQQLAEIARQRALCRDVISRRPLMGRSVIVVDDGVATGSTMISALQTMAKQRPREVVVAFTVASPEGLRSIRPWCDGIFCALRPNSLWDIEQFYDDFPTVDDKDVVATLQSFAAASRGHSFRHSNFIAPANSHLAGGDRSSCHC